MLPLDTKQCFYFSNHNHVHTNNWMCYFTWRGLRTMPLVLYVLPVISNGGFCREFSYKGDGRFESLVDLCAYVWVHSCVRQQMKQRDMEGPRKGDLESSINSCTTLLEPPVFNLAISFLLKKNVELIAQCLNSSYLSYIFWSHSQECSPQSPSFHLCNKYT